RLTEPMENFSRGMQQKVAIARAFLTSPIMMLLDEPTTGLDPRAKREVQRLIKEIVQEHDATVFLTTHDMEEAEQLCDRIGIIHNGEIVALDTPENLKKKVGARNMEEVFMAFTGMRFEDYETAEVV
ncbi:MAG: ABC transporter ATP-binding protein, partial [Thermotogae bacterium]